MAYAALAMLVFATLMSLSSARAVNISNTWMLPEEGFPVFYRYFRDRISWYEADAVCQFHHANIVTADSSSQYDAIRAYLKELDITENVWIGLSKVSDKPNFTWTDFRPLNGEGHWQEAIPKSSDPMCVTMDPAADFLWRAMSCGGPEVASFICELPIPSWALGPRGCLLTELPSLTVLYIPEQSAVELTSDCGLDGTKRIACKGNANREEILKQLTCAISRDDFDEKPTKSPVPSSTTYDTSPDENSLNGKTTKTWIWTSNTVDIDYGMPTRHRRETEDTLSPISTKSTAGLSTMKGPYQKKLITPGSFTTPTMSSENEVTTDVLENDPTLDASVSKVADKSSGIRGTRQGLTTQRPTPEEHAEMVSTVSPTTGDSKITVADVEEGSVEYPSAINQGQLFSIIENGTMFDIIELNDSNTDGAPKTQQNTITSDIKTELKQALTTASPLTAVKNPKNKILNKKDVYKETELKKSVTKMLPKDSVKLEGKHTIDPITKEHEMYPIIKDTSIKLNRTFRKELPPILNDISGRINDGNNLGTSKLINLSINNDLSDPENQHIEVKLQEGEKSNTKTLIIMASKMKHFEESNKNSAPNSNINIELSSEPRNITNNLINKTASKFDAIYEKTTSEQIGKNQNPKEIKKHFFSKSPTTDFGTTDTSIKYVYHTEYGTSQNPLEAEPEGPPRPNRQRQLTRPQRRSFYPNFFSRVLG